MLWVSASAAGRSERQLGSGPKQEARDCHHTLGQAALRSQGRLGSNVEGTWRKAGMDNMLSTLPSEQGARFLNISCPTVL